MSFLKELLSNRKTVLVLAKNDFKTKYSGSYFGVLWAILQPLVTILVFWFVFQIGLRVTAIEKNVPYSLWFICGLVPWFFFSEALASATNCFYEYSYLVKKLVFKISLLPLVKIISSLFIHIIFIVFLLVVYISYGYSINFESLLWIIYFTLCTLLLVFSISLITSSIVVFFKDLSQIIGIILQFGMWMTPIMWSTKLIPNRLEWLFQLNPMFYIVEGYRSVLIHTNFDQFFQMTVLYWCGLIITFVVGVFCFRKLKPHFADVL
ncbi:ABC transporter permease [Paenibacillus cellulositrophicus]|uniref:ABC transporter permease n=1 Tax=Paenibacillus cellulositrophicus TaxID=562959 RepID=UPI003F7D6A46